MSFPSLFRSTFRRARLWHILRFTPDWNCFARASIILFSFFIHCISSTADFDLTCSVAFSESSAAIFSLARLFFDSNEVIFLLEASFPSDFFSCSFILSICSISDLFSSFRELFSVCSWKYFFPYSFLTSHNSRLRRVAISFLPQTTEKKILYYAHDQFITQRKYKSIEIWIWNWNLPRYIISIFFHFSIMYFKIWGTILCTQSICINIETIDSCQWRMHICQMNAAHQYIQVLMGS